MHVKSLKSQPTLFDNPQDERNFSRALAAIFYLARKSNIPAEIELYRAPGADIPAISSCHGDLVGVIAAVLYGFRNAYRVRPQSQIEGAAWYRYVTHIHVKEVFPTARERLECRRWLHELFMQLVVSVTIIDTTFPISDNQATTGTSL